jgi:hypothetical protein
MPDSSSRFFISEVFFYLFGKMTFVVVAFYLNISVTDNYKYKYYCENVGTNDVKIGIVTNVNKQKVLAQVYDIVSNLRKYSVRTNAV